MRSEGRAKKEDVGEGYEERLTIHEGDIVVFGPDGKEITLEEQKARAKAIEKGDCPYLLAGRVKE